MSQNIQEALGDGAKTAQDPKMFNWGLVPVELPPILQAPKNTKSWLVDQVLCIYVERHRGATYCYKKDKKELLRVSKHPDMVRLLHSTPRKQVTTRSFDGGINTW